MASSVDTMKPEEALLEPEDTETAETNEISSDEGATGRKRANPASNLDEDKKAERRAANRRSAFQSRQRRKILIEDLQRTVSALSKDNGDLRKTNEDLRVQLEATLLENHQFRMQQQLAGVASSNPAFLGGSSLQSTQALLRGGNQSALSQLLASGRVPGLAGNGASGQGSTKGSSTENGDPLLNARLALAAAQPRTGDKMSQSQGSAAGSTQSSADKESPSPATSSPKPQQNGIQGILNAASLTSNVAGNVGFQGLLQNAGRNPQLAGLQAMLDCGGAAGLQASAGSQLAGLQGLVEQLRGGSVSGGLTEAQRSLLQRSSAQGGNQSAVSDALRSLLQKKA